MGSAGQELSLAILPLQTGPLETTRTEPSALFTAANRPRTAAIVSLCAYVSVCPNSLGPQNGLKVEYELLQNDAEVRGLFFTKILPAVLF